MKNRHLLKLVAALLAVLMLVGMAACSNEPTGDKNPNQPSQETQERPVHFGLTGDPGTLDPFSSYSGARRFTLLYPVYETLVTKDGAKYENVLAKDYTEVEGEEFPTYDVTLYENIVDSAGNPFTADDLVWCVNTHLTNGVVQETAHVDRVEKTGDYSVRVYMADYTVGAFMSFMMGTPMVTKAAYEASGDDKMATKPVGTGPYLLSEYVSGSKLSYTKNENYWQPVDKQTSSFQKQNIKEYDISIIKEANQAAIALENGDIDFFSGINYETANRFAANYPNLTAQPVYSGGDVLLIMNCSDDSVLAGNVKLRQCLMHALDVESFIAGVTNGVGRACYDLTSPFAVDYLKEFESQDYFKFDLDLCKQLLSEAGYQPGELKLRLLVSPVFADLNTLGQMYQAHLSEIGIELELLNYENALFEQYKTNPNEWEMMLDLTGLTYMSDFYRKLDAREYTAETRSSCFVDDAKLYDLVAQACSENTTNDTVKMELHNYVVEQAYARGVYAYGNMYAYRNDVFTELEFNSSSSCIAGRSSYVWNQ